MTKELDLSFLKNMPKGRELYSTVYGNVKFERCLEFGAHPIEVKTSQTKIDHFDITGRFYRGQGECALFPSEECKDWENWRIVLIQEGDFIISQDYNVEFVFKIDGSFNSVANEGGGFIRVMRSLNNNRIAGWADSKQIEKFKEQLKEAGYEIKGGIIVKIERPKKFDPTALQPFDKVLVRNNDKEVWSIDLFRVNDKNSNFPYVCMAGRWSQCIPYNNATMFLVNTNDTPSGFYDIF